MISEDEMGTACSMHGIEKKCIQGIGQKTEGQTLEELNVDGMIMIKWFLKKLDCSI
jgi:hypothetical protein